MCRFIKGKTALIVNVASNCGFTGQYAGMQEVYDKYKDRNFVVLGFPCNQFGGQEPGTDEEVNTFACTKYKVSFPMFSKVDVNGDKASPLYKYLKEQKGGWFGDGIKWNFSKFLVSKDGTVIEVSYQCYPITTRAAAHCYLVYSFVCLLLRSVAVPTAALRPHHHPCVSEAARPPAS